ncbi:far upstream element-binding protein 1-like [Telopea speciosissima]|uniref:far upstream element-binding protein 1-like n=1 Tax=Telopea speciosissima TaxID=54955 RepID=UPI001CC5CC5B|nr:far upstream element-binding protein 1-like [Telopea speciosissima]XP_043709011.1 far upstream element-binding protein 1-like [Telopea speciosissima]
MGEEEAYLHPETDTNKRKLEEIQLAKQKAQEIVARLVNDAGAKRTRFDDSSESYSGDFQSNSTFSDLAPKPSVQLSVNAQTGTIPFAAQSGSYHAFQGTNKKIEIPNGKVGVIIGKGGDTIKYLQLQSGARIQVTKDTEADPYAQTREVELCGTPEQISRAEQLIKDVLAETDAGGSGSSANRGYPMQQGGEQVTMKVPNDRVALIIGKGGETIKNMQSRSGARIQIIPLHLPPGDTSTERTVYINGTNEQIESAKESINELISGNRVRNTSMSGGYAQPGYRPTGNWVPPGPPPMQQPGYGYAQPGTYTSPPPPYYGSYPPPGQWDQSSSSTVPPPPQQATGYNYYGQPTQTGSAPPDVSYGYGQNSSGASHGYDQGYAQQTQTYGQDATTQAPQEDQQNPYAAPGYGPPSIPPQLDGTTPAQPYGTQSSTQPLSAYPPPYSQPPTHQPGYGTQSYPGPPTHQPEYDQTGFTQSGYGAQQPAPLPPPAHSQLPTSQPAYGQAAYPQQPVPLQSSYVQGTNTPAYGQSQPHLATHGYSQQVAYGVERNAEGNTAAPSYGSAPVAQELARPQS